ncbi:MAG TPA: hypothetical protein VGK19_05205 [Capsulimonadaceae bacterium]|jgi:hypothetical protein
MHKLAGLLSLAALSFAACRINAIATRHAAIAAARAHRQADLWPFGADNRVTNDSPIVRIAYTIIVQGAKENATEIYIIPGETGVRIDVEIEGERSPMMQLPKHIQRPIEFCLRSGAARSTETDPIGGCLLIAHDGTRYRYRLTRSIGAYGSILKFTRYEPVG